MNIILLCQCFSCFFMTGLIWLIQLVHYPTFHYVADEMFIEAHEAHSRKITWIVFPVMLLELFSAAMLAWKMSTPIWILNFGSVLLLWLLTAFVAVPLHNRLAKGKSPIVITRLCQTNLPRTILWSFRSVGLLGFLMTSATIG